MKTTNVWLLPLFLLLFFSCSKEELQIEVKQEDQIEAKKQPLATWISFYAETEILNYTEYIMLINKLSTMDRFNLESDCNYIGFANFDPTIPPPGGTGVSDIEIDYLPNNTFRVRIVDVRFLYTGGDPILNYVGENIQVYGGPNNYGTCPLADFVFPENRPWVLPIMLDLSHLYDLSVVCPVIC